MITAIVTRPRAQTLEWVASLVAHGIDAVPLPLIEIAPALDSAPVGRAWASVAARRLVVFVSPNAAQVFFAARTTPEGWPRETLAASPGPGTTRVLRQLGVPAACIVEPAADADQFDSESLWAELGALDWQGADVLLVRGDVGREWLADRLRERGARVDGVAAYRRIAPTLDAGGRALLDESHASPHRFAWLFGSSEAIDHLGTLTAGRDWRNALALATHPRIAARAQQLGIGRVIEVRPALDAVVACIQSIGT